MFKTSNKNLEEHSKLIPTIELDKFNPVVITEFFFWPVEDCVFQPSLKIVEILFLRRSPISFVLDFLPTYLNSPEKSLNLVLRLVIIDYFPSKAGLKSLK